MKHNVFYSLFLGMTGFVFCWDLEKGGDGHSPTVTVEPWKPYGSRFPGTVEPNRGPRFHGSTVWRIHGARSFLPAASWHQGHLDCSVRLRCLPVCRRLCRALRFALLHANGDYPVVLTKVTKVSRTRKYFFQTSVGKSFTLFSCHVPLRFQQKFGTSMLEPESRECQVKARTGHQISFTATEQANSCRIQWERVTKARRSGGLLAAVKPCQIIAALKLVYTHESPTGVYFFLAELLQSFAEAHGTQLKNHSRHERVQFLRKHLPLVWYDCACTLKKFIAAKKHRNRNKMTRTLSKLRLAIDKFHFRKGHSGCRPNGTSPLPCLWPQKHTKLGCLNDSAAEQSFAFLKRISVAARRMTPVRGLLFVLLLQHARNASLEEAGI